MTRFVANLRASGLALAVLTLASPAQAAERIVALGSSITEIVYALGAEGELVGVDTTSMFPPNALKEKASVGYFRQVSAEGVLSLAPSRIVAVEGAGPKDVLATVTAAGVKLDMLGDDYTEAGVIDRIARVGALVGKTPEAKSLERKVAARFAELANARAAIVKPARALFVIALQNGRPMVAGKGTAADAMIRFSGAANVAEGVQGYKLMTDEAIVAAAPDVVIAMAGGGQAITADAIFALPAFSTAPAAAGRRLIIMDGTYLLGFGPRTPDAALDLMQRIAGDAQPAR